MTETMVERVAKAIEAARDEDLPDPMVMARAAIAAMREPTKVVADACESFIYEGWGDSQVIGLECWQACIDAALEPE